MIQDSAPVAVPNVVESEQPEDDIGSPAECDVDEDSEPEPELNTDSDSGYGSDAPATPQDKTFAEIPILTSPTLDKDGALADSDLASEPLVGSIHTDEEDDDLPPFDEWYQTIARRAT